MTVYTCKGEMSGFFKVAWCGVVPEVDGGDATTPGRKIGVAVSPAAIVVVLKWKIQIEREPDL